MAWNKTKTKLCKHCKTEIPGDAKVCPNCKKKQGGIGKIILIVAIVLVVVGIIGGALGSKEEEGPKKVNNNSSVSEGKEETSKEEEQPANFKPGETADLKGVQVTFVNFSESTGNDFFKPSDGKVLVTCEFEITNNSEEEIAVSSLVSFKAYCDDYAVDLDLNALLANQDKEQLDGSVAPGKKMNGIVGYEVPTDWKTLEVNFTPDFWSGKEIKFVATK